MKKIFTIAIILVVLITNAQVPSYVPANGLVAYYPFNGNANDESGNGNNGTVTGATLTTDKNGNNNSAYDFNYNGMQWNSGLHQATNIPYNSSFNSNTITVSIWFYARSYFFSGITGNDKVSRLVTRYQYGYNNPNGQTWGIDLSNNQLTAFINQAATDNNQVGVVASTNVSLNQWNHVAFTFDNTSLKLFLNGVLVSETPKPPTFSLNTIGNSGISVGCSNQANGYWYESDAKIDEIGFWNRALTLQEITALYNTNQCITNITVTDTLIINVGQLSFNEPVTWANNITIFPNPASTQININFNNITNLNGGTLKIINSLGQQVATTPITTSGTNSTMQLATWGGSGMYFVQIVNSQGQIVDIKKIILQ
jgi:hypothetical protein